MIRWLLVSVAAAMVLLADVRANVVLPDVPPAWDYLRGTWGEPLSVADFRCQTAGWVAGMAVDYGLYPSYRSGVTNPWDGVDRWYGSEDYRRTTMFLNLRWGLASKIEFGLRVPITRIAARTNYGQPRNSGVSDILATLRVPVYRARSDSTMISLGIGYKVATGEWKRAELPTSTGTDDIVVNGYASGYMGGVYLSAHIGVAHAAVQHDDDEDVLKKAYTYELSVGSETVKNTAILVGFSGYGHESESGETSDKISFVPRVVISVGGNQQELELGCHVDINGKRSLNGMQAYVGYSIRLGRN